MLLCYDMLVYVVCGMVRSGVLVMLVVIDVIGLLGVLFLWRDGVCCGASVLACEVVVFDWCVVVQYV